MPTHKPGPAVSQSKTGQVIVNSHRSAATTAANTGVQQPSTGAMMHTPALWLRGGAAAVADTIVGSIAAPSLSVQILVEVGLRRLVPAKARMLPPVAADAAAAATVGGGGVCG